MRSHRNLTEAIASRCTERPDHSALVLVGGSGAEWGGTVRHVRYADLDRDGRRIAAWLQSRYAPGERVLIQESDPHLFAVSLLGCLYAGLVAVPAPPPNGAGNARRRCLAMVRDAAARVILTDAAAAGAVSRELSLGGYGGVECAPVDVLLSGAAPAAGDWRMPDLAPDSVALLQYTSGSTRIPRGVVIEHRHLLANQEAIRGTLGTGPDSVLGGWLPMYHDMGLIGQLLHPLFLGATTVLMTADAFVREPLRWLRLIAEHRVRVSGAPNFGYQTCLDRVRDDDAERHGLDLGHWEIAINGGEPVRASTVRGFQSRFARFGLRPGTVRVAYGLAEATLLVSCSEPRSARPDALEVDRAALEKGRITPAGPGRQSASLVGSGRVRGLDVRIVDPETSQSVPDGHTGEIWLRGASIGNDYWRRPPGSAHTFHGVVDGAEDDGEYLQTGDLGALCDGELYITGRSSELIIVAGRGLHPLDVEQSVQRISTAFAAGAAFGLRPEEQDEQLVIVQEVRLSRAQAEPAGSLERLAVEIRARIADDFAVHTGGVVLVRTGTVRRTTSGKLERAAVRKLYLDGRLNVLHELVEPPVRSLVHARQPDRFFGAPARERRGLLDGSALRLMPAERRSGALRGWLAARLARRLHLPGIAHDQNLHDLGLDSSTALSLAGDIEAHFGLAVDAAVAFDHPTIADLAVYLARRLDLIADAGDANPGNTNLGNANPGDSERWPATPGGGSLGGPVRQRW